MKTPQEWAREDKKQRRIVDAIFAPENFARLGTAEEQVAWNRAALVPPPPQVIGVVQGWNPVGGSLY